MPAWLLNRQHCRCETYLTEMSTFQLQKPHVKKDPLLSCLTLETARDKVVSLRKCVCSRAFWWYENTNDYQARAHLLKGTHFHVSHLHELGTTGIVSYKRCRHSGYTLKQISYWRHCLRPWFQLLDKLATFILKFCKWESLAFQRNDTLIELNDIIS